MSDLKTVGRTPIRPGSGGPDKTRSGFQMALTGLWDLPTRAGHLLDYDNDLARLLLRNINQ